MARRNTGATSSVQSRELVANLFAVPYHQDNIARLAVIAMQRDIPWAYPKSAFLITKAFLRANPDYGRKHKESNRERKILDFVLANGEIPPTQLESVREILKSLRFGYTIFLSRKYKWADPFMDYFGEEIRGAFPRCPEKAIAMFFGDQEGIDRQTSDMVNYVEFKNLEFEASKLADLIQHLWLRGKDFCSL